MLLSMERKESSSKPSRDELVQIQNKEFKRIFEVNPDLLSVVDVETGVVKRNQAWMEMLGYSGEKLRQLKMLALIHPEDKTATETVLKNLADGQVVSFINRYRHSNGAYHYLEWRVQCYGKQLFAAGRDITSEVKNKEELKVKLEVARLLLELGEAQYTAVEDLLDGVLERVIALTKSQLGYIFLCDEEEKEISLHSWSQAVHASCAIKEERVYSLSHVSLWGEVVRQHKEVVVNDYNATSLPKHGFPAGHVAIEKFLSIPVIDRGKIVAIVGLANKSVDYTEEDALNLKTIMSGVWTQVERVKNEALLQRERALFSATLFSLHEGVISTDADGKILVMNKSAEELTGWSSEEAGGKKFAEVFSSFYATTKERTLNPVNEVLATGELKHVPADVVLIDKSGMERYIAGTCAPAIGTDGIVKGAIVNFRDITTAWQKQKLDEYLSQHDGLTGAFNRFFFKRRIEEEISWSERYREPLSIMMLDLDFFKRINDTWGHPAGDGVLKELAQLLRGLIRKSDLLVRLGGEEFIIVMPQTNSSEAVGAAEKIRAYLAKYRFALVGRITVSIGVAEHRALESFDSWYQRVDSAMYEAKKSGRNCVKSADGQKARSVMRGLPKWKEEWESGHAGIDKQHRELIELGNILYDLSIQGTDDKLVLEQLDRVLNYLVKHISYEEKILVRTGYPGYERHKKIHEGLLEIAFKLRETYTQRRLRPAIFFSFFIDDFIFGHILQEDNDFFSYLRQDLEI